MFLERGPHHIGSVYKKAMFRQYTDATYSYLAPRPAWLGFLGPILRAEVDDVIVVHLKNFATKNYSMHPHGVFYEKDSEGIVLHNTYIQYVHIDKTHKTCKMNETSPRQTGHFFIESDTCGVLR